MSTTDDNPATKGYSPVRRWLRAERARDGADALLMVDPASPRTAGVPDDIQPLSVEAQEWIKAYTDALDRATPRFYMDGI